MRSDFVLQSVTSARQINLSPLNSSTSKHLFSFSRGSRFKLDPPYCDSIYDIPSYFQRTHSSFNKSRTKFNSTHNSYRGDRFDDQVLQVGPTFSMRKKLKVIDKKMSIEAQNDNPGSGSYENPEALSPRGSYFLTKHKNTGITRFNPRSSQRFLKNTNVNPGPGRYNEINQLSDEGRYSLSKTNGFGKRFFDKEHRVVKFEFESKKNYNPGPGSYRSPSDFGNYDGDVYNRTGGISYIGSSRRRPSRSRF